MFAAARFGRLFESLGAGAKKAPALLQKQEPIQGPENASIARFDGLCCY